ncbi:MAG: class I SAM-dependent methyltransferase [Verrucomicrobia bacterium]|nr:class I SAM-dependent methyltransferase [Verrucomicrobiota bacterium]
MSADPVRELYAEVSYPGSAFAQTHPARHAAIARLLGRPAADVRKARILEVGCAQGYNLLPLAAQLPQAHFVGVDFSDQELARGRALSDAAGLTNVEFVCADLRTYAPPAGSFDFIIAHGVLSWVPDDVKSALFALCARALSPDGLAYISYNTYPGWKQREAVRELMLMRLGGIDTPAGRLAAAHATLDDLDKLFAGRTESHAELTRGIIASMRRKQSGHFYHDDLDGVNDPCYFLQFAAWAAEHGLAYLAEAEWETMFPELLPEAARAQFARFSGDRLQLEQQLDFLRNRTFRCSLLTRTGGPAVTHPDPAALRTCAFAAHLRPPVAVPPLDADTPVRFGANSAQSFETKDPVVKALFCVLAAAWPQRVPFAELLPAVQRLLSHARVTLPADLEHALLSRLLEATGRRFVDCLSTTGITCVPTPSAAPWVHPLTRLMAAQGLPVANAWHEIVPLDDSARALLATLDGRRTVFTEYERALLARFAAAGLGQTAPPATA